MGRIQSSVGLITGVPIAETVEQLIALAARPRDLLQERTAQLSQQQVAITELTALAIGVEFAVGQLGFDSVFQQRVASSSDDSLLSVSVTGEPNVGNHQFTPVRQAQSHQLLSSGFPAADLAIGAGTLKFRFGGFVNEGVRLAELNGGAGVQRGQIRITDRSGSSAVVDLRFAQTVDDVLQAINSQEAIDVTAVTDGDRLKLIDNTGQAVVNLKVQNVGLATTADDLGLSSINIADDEASGQDVLSLHDNVLLSRLNDGNGVSIRGGLPDLEITFQDGSANLQVDLDGVSTVGELLQTLNADGRLTAAISSDGDRIELTDNTAGGNPFSVFSPVGGSAAEDLGFTASAVNGVITARRLQGGLKTSLISSLGGGSGPGELGQLLITDRDGNSTSVDLSTAETLDDLINTIRTTVQSAGVGVDVSVNAARNGLLLKDTSGGTGNLIVANDGQNTADKLKLTVNAAVDKIDSGALDLQVFSEQIRIEDLNNGHGVQNGSFLITDSSGATGAVNLSVLAPETVGDVLDAINSLGIGVQARINETGDGILLADTAGGSGKLTVTDSGNGTAAADLGIAGTSVEVDLDGNLTEVIDGSTTLTVEIDADDTLTDVVEKINALTPDVAASIFNEGSGVAPFRLALNSLVAGKAGELLIDTTGVNFRFQELTQAQDALLLVGSADALGAGVLVSSSDNTFGQVVEGLSLTVNGSSTSPVTVTVDSTDASLISKMKQFVDAYNKLRTKLDEVTFFDPESDSTGILFGTGAALRLENDLANLVTDRFFGAGDVQSLGELGVDVKDDGTLELDEEKLKNKFAADPDAVREFFTTEDFGVAPKFKKLIDSLAGEENSLLLNRTAALQSTIDQNNERIEFLNERLERQRERLLKEFFALEEAISRLQSGLTAIESLQPLPPLRPNQS